MSVEPRVIEDDGGNTFTDVSSARTINDDDKLERLERNLQRAKELNDVGKESSAEPEQKKQKKSDTKKKAATGETDDPNVVYAPSIDEVTADNDHLASLRGEGRYFGVVDPDVNEPICSNCHRRGHRRAQCKVVVCHACGKVDDHYETQCPNSMVCSNCGEKGHFRNNCPSKRNYTFCVLCDSRNHISERCPTIWRSYVVKRLDTNAKIPYPSAKIFCYNCAAKGHYGDDCKKQRTSKTPNINGSAFSGENLPKALISQYKNMLAQSYSSDNTSRKRTYDDANTNYNYAPPPYPRYNNNNNYNNNKNNYNNNNSYNNNNNYNSNLPKGPKKGYIPSRNQNQNQGRNNYNDNRNNNYNDNRNNYNDNRNNNYRSSYNNNNGQYNRGNYSKRY